MKRISKSRSIGIAGILRYLETSNQYDLKKILDYPKKHELPIIAREIHFFFYDLKMHLQLNVKPKMLKLKNLYKKRVRLKNLTIY